MKKKFAIVTVTLMMGLSVVACSKNTNPVKPETSTSPNATESANGATTSPSASTEPTKDTPYTQEQEIKFQTRDISGYVTLGEYKGVKIDAVDATVSDQDVEDTIQSTLKENATYKETAKDYKAANGDQVVIDFVGKIDGKAFDGGSAEDQTLILGSKTYIEGFEEGIVGHKAGTTFDINVTFPATYGTAELAGKDAVFTITLDSIKNTVIPELNDAFVQKVSTTSKTVAEYRAEVKKQLEETAKSSKKSKEENAIWKAIVDASKVKEYPADLVEYYAYNSRKQLVTQLASSYTMTLEDYLNATGKSEEEFDKEREEDAKLYLQQLMVLQSIAKKEGLDVTDEQYKTELQKVLDSNNFKSEDELKQTYGNLTPYTIKKSILYDNVTNYIVSNAIIK